MGKLSKDKRDIYYRLAKQNNYRSRAAYKLIQVDYHFNLLENSSLIVDLCAAPGGFSQVCSKRLKSKKSKKIISVDLQEIAPIEDVDILNVPSKRRNPILADIFGRLKYMERRGSGFKKIINAYETQQNYKNALKPIFNSFNNDFILTLFNLNYSANVPQAVPQDDLDIKILDLIKNNNKISTQEIGNVLGVSDKTIKRHIKNTDYLKYIGSGYSGHWEIVDR